MNDARIADMLLQGCGLTSVDAARLVLEMLEQLGELAQSRNHHELMRQLRRVIGDGVRAVAQAEYTVSLEKAAWDSVESRMGKLRPVTLSDLRYYLRRILRCPGVAELPLRTIRTETCREILHQAFGNSTSSYVKGRAILHSVFAYGIRREWCDINPVARIEVPRVEERTIVPLSPQEVEQLLQSAKGGDMQLSLNLLLYGGIRPAEVARLRPADFCWEEQQVIIRPRTSKTGGGRVVPLRRCANLSKELRVIPRNWFRRWKQQRQAAGFRYWEPDICRHTFACYHAAYFRNLPSLQLEMGHHSLELLRCRYVFPTTAAAARRFWHCEENQP